MSCIIISSFYVCLCAFAKQEEKTKAKARMRKCRGWKKKEKKGKWKADIKTKGGGDGICDASDAQRPSFATRCHVQTHAGLKEIYMRRTSLSCSKPRNGVSKTTDFFFVAPILFPRKDAPLVRNSTRPDKKIERSLFTIRRVPLLTKRNASQSGTIEVWIYNDCETSN